MLNLLPHYMAECLVLTVLIEMSLAAILGVRKGKDFANILLANIITNPIVVSLRFCIGFLYGRSAGTVSIIVLELLAFVTEGFIYSHTLKFRSINPFLLSLILNAASYITGLLIYSIL